ncbi:hypothetical protein SAMN05444414_14616 [Roseovarius marisflavi]|uniref:EF-hand domain-containing protein n=1 Tax=Roseovarius marisflavi TaxID=1054996 RepID=A0A1M7DPX6_9RHOB|nr:hypothetical protein [Roseovarius marisflavi]SHL81554.1 hypothetical protein SAMN05444414_14616 [Roseovarius marisflavi]
MKFIKKAVQSIVPRKEMFDVNGDGKIDHNDILDAAKGVSAKMTPSKSSFDLNGDGILDHKDAVIGAKLAGAAVAAAGVTLSAGAVAGVLIVSGTATSIATGVVATAGAAAGSFLGVVLGSSTTGAYAAYQTVNGILIITAAKATTVS